VDEKKQLIGKSGSDESDFKGNINPAWLSTLILLELLDFWIDFI